MYSPRLSIPFSPSQLHIQYVLFVLNIIIQIYVQIVARVRPPLPRELDLFQRQYESAVSLDEATNSITLSEYPQSYSAQAAAESNLVRFLLILIQLFDLFQLLTTREQERENCIVSICNDPHRSNRTWLVVIADYNLHTIILPSTIIESHVLNVNLKAWSPWACSQLCDYIARACHCLLFHQRLGHDYGLRTLQDNLGMT